MWLINLRVIHTTQQQTWKWNTLILTWLSVHFYFKGRFSQLAVLVSNFALFLQSSPL